MAALLLLLEGCGGKKISKAPPSDPLELYRKGLVLFNEGRYKKATEAFSRFVSYFPEERDLAAKAELKLADCAFMSKDYPEAITRYTEFKKRHPFHPDVPYADFQIAMAHYRQIRSKDRDQETTRKALAAFENVLRKYPGTIFAQKASEKIAFCKRRLAEHEIYVGKFYLKKKKLKAAQGRFRAALAYRGSGLEDRALYLLALALHKEGRDDEAASYLALLERSYPQSKESKKAKALLARLKVKEIAEVKWPTPAPPTPPAPAERAEELKIEARSQERLPGLVLYSGDVKLRLGDLSIRADELRVRREEGGKPVEVVAKGDVKVTKGPREILCGKASLDLTEDLLTMEDNPRFSEAGQLIRGKRMTLDLSTDRLHIEGKKVKEEVTLPAISPPQ